MYFKKTGELAVGAGGKLDFVLFFNCNTPIDLPPRRNPNRSSRRAAGVKSNSNVRMRAPGPGLLGCGDTAGGVGGCVGGRVRGRVGGGAGFTVSSGARSILRYRESMTVHRFTWLCVAY